ncbi:hypothetical protein EDC44_1098 [Cricetibacter osteomyelitidis]|uniref:Glycosyl transferase family 2 n=1 Tax=Cricetibacter osteomyelitidis TaxID=1521931 RepID=A0A4R2SXU7_9PAST|nr:hypothetical protein [Cricetibacter osteomyelitidis]TCP95317.1 hypothetical protein EDC44_1098 [Cricetibacter osteomyelitidis]
MLPESALCEMFPLIVTPSHDGKYFHNYTISLISLISEANRLGMPLQVLLQRGESLITRARNNCVAQFLENKAWTHLFWIDSDIGFSPMAFFRLLLADRDIAAGIYPLKKEDWPAQGLPKGMTQADFEAHYTHYTVNAHTADENGILQLNVDNDGFMNVDEAPTGFMVIKRQVFEKMIEAYPNLAYVSDSDYSKPGEIRYRLFDCAVDPISKRYLSEDYFFCRLWRDIGGEVAVDVQSNLTHQGAKLYSGSFAQSLQTNIALAVYAPAGMKMQLNLAAPLKENVKGF